MNNKNLERDNITIIKNVFGCVVEIALLIFFMSIYCEITWASKNYLISHYREDSFVVSDRNGKFYEAIRTFIMDREKKILIVDPYTFETQIVNLRDFIIVSKKFTAVLDKTPYKKALATFTAPPYALENYGVTHSLNQQAGVFLTVDMCPSSKPFEREFFLELAKKQVPIALSMTGLWAVKHPIEFDWLIEQRTMHTLKITWVNHSYHHHYHVMTPINEHFLSVLKASLVGDIMSLEKMLIQKGETPSVFFRFPGLISSHDTIVELRHLGLIPIATDAWLAKGQKARPGSIILVHGNSNEHEGINIMMRLLKNKVNTYFLPLNKVFY